VNLLLSNLKVKDTIKYEAILDDYLKNQFDIIRINSCSVVCDYVYYSNKLKINLSVKTNLVLSCSVTGLEVIQDLEFMEELSFGRSLDDDYPLEKEINLDELVFAYIYSNKPYCVYHPSVSDEFR